MLENVQVIKENGEARFAVIDFQEYLDVKALLTEPEKLNDYLDYLHMQKVKRQSKSSFSLNEVKQELGHLS